jgi:hypothetical protein
MNKNVAIADAQTFSMVNGVVCRVYRIDWEYYFERYDGRIGPISLSRTVCYTLPSGIRTVDVVAVRDEFIMYAQRQAQ